MNPWAGIARNEKGVALPLALFVLVSLSAFVLAFLSMGGMEPQVARNLSDTAQARYVADAGIEWAFDQLANPATNWSTVLQTGNPPGQMANAMTLPGLPATYGTFTVTVRNDTLATDTALTGVAPDANATTDANGVLIVTAAGTYNNVSRQIQVVISRTTLLPLPGALNFPGVQTDINPGGTAHLHINGVDYNRDGSLGTGPLKFGLTVASGINPSTGTTYEQYVEASLTRHDMNEMTGRDQTKPCCVAIQRGSDLNCPCEGENTIVSQDVLPASEQLTPKKIDTFVQAVKQSGVNVINVNPAKPLVLNSGVPTDPTVSVNLGTVANPTITYIKGSADPNDRYTSLSLNGNTSGAGILILDNADMAISGTFRWDGVILLTGMNVGITFKMNSRAFLYGGVVVDEKDKMERAGSYEMLIEPNAHGDSSVDQFTTFYSSQQNLDMVQNMLGKNRGLLKASTWREL